MPAALRALSDLYTVFKPRDPRTAAKVMFYAAQVRRASAPFLRGLGADAERWAARLEKEADEKPSGLENEAVETQDLVDIRGPEGLNQSAQKAPIIVELS